jgi:hypothetical protein
MEQAAQIDGSEPCWSVPCGPPRQTRRRGNQQAGALHVVMGSWRGQGQVQFAWSRSNWLAGNTGLVAKISVDNLIDT